MCTISSVQLNGSFWDSNGDPTKVTIDARVDASDLARNHGCDYVNIAILRSQNDANPLFTANSVPVPANGIVSYTFTVGPAELVHCGDVLWVEVSCWPDKDCRTDGEVRLECKGFDGPRSCPPEGPPYSVDPPFDPFADCVGAATYTVTIGGAWPAGTTYSWSIGDYPPGITHPTTEHSASFAVNQTGGSPGKMLIAVVTVPDPNCEPVMTAVLIPPADSVNCPTQVNITVTGLLGQLPFPADGMTYDALPPGDYMVRVTFPTGSTVQYEWFLNNVIQSVDVTTPNELIVSVAVDSSSTIAVRAVQECCTPLLDTVILIGAKKGDDDSGAPIDPGTNTETPPEVEMPEFPDVNWPCLILGGLVAISIFVALVAIVASVASAPIAAFALPLLIVAVIVIIVTGLLLLLICGSSLCRILRIFAWAFKWAVVMGAIIAFAVLSFVAFLVILIYGMITAAFVWALVSRGCRDPDMFSFP